MKTIEVSEKDVQAAFKVAKSDEMKNVLAALFCKPEKEEERVKPTLDDYKTIKTYEDACEALGIDPKDKETVFAELPKHIVALIKLETISHALWGRNWEPKPQGEWDGRTYFYFPWFVLYSEREVKDIMAAEDHNNVAALFAGIANDGANAGFGYLVTYYRPANAFAYFGFRLCQESEEKARYFASTFAELWAEYLAFNFTVGERLL